MQFLLRPILQSKLRAHELYEIERMEPMYAGAAARAKAEGDTHTQLQLSGGVAKRVAPLIVERRHCFVVSSADLALLLKQSHTYNAPVALQLASAIIASNKPVQLQSDLASALHATLSDHGSAHTCLALAALILPPAAARVAFFTSVIAKCPSAAAASLFCRLLSADQLPLAAKDEAVAHAKAIGEQTHTDDHLALFEAAAERKTAERKTTEPSDTAGDASAATSSAD